MLSQYKKVFRQLISSWTKEKLENNEMKENEDTPYHNLRDAAKTYLESSRAINDYISNQLPMLSPEDTGKKEQSKAKASRRK